jgi:PhzF family phenazine biosynthesis protein
MSQRIVFVDSFTNRAFAGNPAAVCLLGSSASDRWMQHVAAEMNLSETAFVYLDEEPGVFRLRWFTPRVEVDLCGHATLAAAHVLWEEKHLVAADPARFQTRSGRLTAIRRGDWIELDFPAEPAQTTIDDPAELERISLALNGPVVSACRNRFDLLAELGDEPTVRSLRPDIGLVARFPIRGIIATSLSSSSSSGFDFVSRFFAPRVGIDEDPVCGSAHCFLAPFWAARLGRNTLTAHQVSNRGGIVRLRLEGDRVALIGQAVTVLKGELTACASP